MYVSVFVSGVELGNGRCFTCLETTTAFLVVDSGHETVGAKDPSTLRSSSRHVSRVVRNTLPCIDSREVCMVRKVVRV